MSEPTTKAGRALLDELTGALARRSILAIEREAVAQERARIRAAVDGLPDQWGPSDEAGYVRRKDVLRLLDPEAEGGTE